MNVLLVLVTMFLTAGIILGTAFATYKLITSSIQFEFEQNTGEVVENEPILPLTIEQKASIEEDADNINKTLDEKLKQW